MQTPENIQFTPANATERAVQMKGLEADIKNHIQNYFTSHGYGELVVSVSSFEPDTVLPSSTTIKIKAHDPSNPAIIFNTMLADFTPNDLTEIEEELTKSLTEKFPTIN